ncbi:MAG: hypothetical protein LBD23_01880, partial [Oscillospiraceae bacterium]|nr:hypothetical protein [Oscillospiraceae bacterium]
MAKIYNFLASLKITILSGIFLAGGLNWQLIAGTENLPSVALWQTGIVIQLHPAWIAVLFSGFPLLYSAISRLLF